VTLDQARISYDTEDQGFKVGILIDAGSHDSPLLLGLEWIKRGTEPVSWTADEKSHEVHFIVQGHLKISSSDGASAVLDPQDSYYFPPGRTYTVENAGDEDVFLVWSITPSPGYQDAEA
jgi:mannose-6-phosphate isomerase-like protein (cupin superfamily)